MENESITDAQLNLLIHDMTAAYEDRLAEDTDKAEEWRSWYKLRIDDLNRLYDNRQDAVGTLGCLLHMVLEIDVLWYASQVRDLRRDLEAERQRAFRLEDEVSRLKGALVQRPQAVTVHIPARQISLRSPIQQEIVRLMGAEGLGRSWRIIARVADAGLAKENSVRNALRRLTERNVIDDYRRHDRPVRWKLTAGGNRRLVLLTETGRAWYQEAFGREPVESEITIAARQHKSVAHGVGILEARDHLRDAGYLVNENPDAVVGSAQERWGARTEPDLIMTKSDESWPVEVQREVSERLLNKWAKILSLADRLALILFNEEQRYKQEEILGEAICRGQLVNGEIRLTSLEAMESGEWTWADIGELWE
ncbi:MAG: hypothetical protein JXA14_08130 [Anaerolineae bacterium]|nr:hypothetical protein [Anaerolineae bacterium]